VTRLRGCLAVILSSYAVLSTVVAADAGWFSRVWQSDDGLPNDTVTGIAQAADGFLWVCTVDRLSRFDGMTFESFSKDRLGLKTLEMINPLLLAHDDALWLGTSRGTVVCLRHGSVQLFTNGLPRHFIRSLTEDGDGAVWVTDVRGNISRIKDGEPKQFGPDDGWSPADCSVATDAQGRLWFVKAGQLGIFQEGRFTELARINGGNDLRIASCRAGGVWVVSGSQLYRYDMQRGLTSFGTLPPSSGIAGPTAMLEDRSGAVWIGTGGNGLVRFDGKGFETVPMSHHDVRTLTQDREGFVWAGMNGGGLYRIGRSGLQMEGSAAGIPMESINSVCEDGQGSIWAATKSGLLICRQDGQWRTVSTNAGWPGDVASCVAADVNGTVWVGTRNRAIYSWRDGYFAMATHPTDRLPVTGAMFTARNGDLWIAQTGTRAVERLRAGQLVDFNISTNAGAIQAFAGDGAGNIWMGSMRGYLFKIEGDEVVNKSSLITGLRAPVRCLCLSSNGTLWIAFGEGGVGRVKDGKFSRLGTDQGLYDDSLSQVIADGAGWLWFGSDHGIFKVRESDLDAVADGRAARVNSIHYGQNEGMKSMEANFSYSPNVLRGRDGRLWMPMRTGIVIIDPAVERSEYLPPMPVLKQMTVDDRVQAWYGGPMPVAGDIADLRNPSSLHLEPSCRRLDFEFTALNFAAPESVRFRYRLSGFDEHWIDAGVRRSAGYSRLPAGNYRFEVNACNADGVWARSPATFAFSVSPFFWQTWWFRLIAVALFAGGMMGAGRYISFRRLRSRLRELEQKAALDRERARIARDIHDDLGGSLTQTVLLLKLTAKNSDDPEKVSGFLQQVSSGVKDVIQSLDEIVWAANPGNDTLPHFVDYIGQFAAEFLQAANIRCRFDFPSEPPDLPLAPEVRHNLFLVLKESLNNVVRHARAQEVRIGLTLVDDVLGMTVHDDGAGFSGEPGPDANGWRNLRQRLNDIGGDCAIESVPGGGTTVSISLPLAALKEMDRR